MKSFFACICLFFTFFLQTVQAQKLVSVTDLGVFNKAFISLTGITIPEYDVHMYKVTYNTTEINGNSGIASGMIALPINPLCDSLPIALYAHGTILKKTNVPSENNEESVIGKAIASRGYVTVMPDYLGLGVSGGLHPYQHAQSEATASVDIIRAAIEFLNDSATLHYNNEIFLTGYSQGGHAAMATAKYIQDQQLEAELNVVASAPLSGAYHASKRQSSELLYDLPYQKPGYIVYLIMSYQLAYGNIYIQISDVLQAPYDKIIPPRFDGTYPIDSVHALLPLKTSDYLNSNFLNSFINDSATQNTALWQALLANDNYDWKPNTPLKMFYCIGDETVNPANTADAYDAMINQGATQVFKEDLGNFTHTGCVFSASQHAIEFFQDLRKDCTVSTGMADNVGSSQIINVFPNPANDKLHINISTPRAVEIEIWSIQGQRIQKLQVFSHSLLNISSYSKGMYLLKIMDNNRSSIIKFTKN